MIPPNFDIVFHYLRYVCLHYEPSKPNKKKIKHLIEAMPYFLPESYQNIFFDLIRSYPLDCYWDSETTMQNYGYILYSCFHKRIKKEFKNREDYDQEVYNTKYSLQKQIHTIVFFIIIIALIYILYRIR
jgi:hypothetical protein